MNELFSFSLLSLDRIEKNDKLIVICIDIIQQKVIFI